MAWGGGGSPEFIITFEEVPDLVIVIECKASTSDHKSKNLDNPKDFAVDGAIHYSSYLSRDFDVIAIGVSGQTKHELLIDNFVRISGEHSARDLQINKILDFSDYVNIRKGDSKRESIDHDRLLKYSRVLNNRLRDDFEFEETLRPLVVSGILLALEDEGFCKSYGKKRTAREVAKLIITTITERLERDNIGGIKKDTMVDSYKFLETNTKIVQNNDPNTNLRSLIKEIETNVKPFLMDYSQYDIIGEFYNEFLRYANGDGGLGIVLTPKHVTELFVDIVGLNNESIILDNCCGTAGFLISAMKRLEDKNKHDSSKINEIHSKQLIGIENNSRMFCLACSNMMLRGDGKSNIYQQDCFEIEPPKITKFKPTVGFLNPPYSKKNGHAELCFIENCLDMLQSNGTCVAIIQQSSVMNTKKENSTIKKRLLKKHTLRAVMSMPDELFRDSDKSVITCVLVFDAHKPHSESKTWFGFWKDDGYEYVKTNGRTDYYGKYEQEIKKYWLDSFTDRKVIDGFSVLRNVDANDEWLAEPYIETRFENLVDDDFITTLRKYSGFLYSNYKSDNASTDSKTQKRLSLNFNSWKKVKLGDLFTVKGSGSSTKRDLNSDEGNYAYVTTQSSNNGVSIWCNQYDHEGNVLTIDSAVVGFCSYQAFNFIASDHVEKLTPKNFTLNVYKALFLTTVINMEQYRYSYGRKFNQTRIRDTEIRLPFDGSDIDWKFIENYIKGLPCSSNLKTKVISS